MQNLKDLVEKSRQQVRTQGELTSGSGETTYNFADNTDYNYPNVNEYSDINNDVGKPIPELSTIESPTNNLIGRGAEQVNSAINSLDDFLEITDPVLENFIFNSEFNVDQTKLRALNRLSGKTFNPLGIISTIEAESNTLGGSIIRQAVSDLLSLGDVDPYQSTDGKTFYSALDTDSQESIFTALEFRQATRGGDGIVGAVVSNAVGSIANAIGLNIPTRSIMAQVVAYNEDLFEDLVDDTYNWFKDEVSDMDLTTNTTVELEPIGGNAVNYLFGSDLLTKDPIKYYEIFTDIRDGLYAQNVFAQKSGEIRYAELLEKAKSDKTTKLIITMGGEALRKYIYNNEGFYKNDRTEAFEPDSTSEPEIIRLNNLLNHLFRGHVSDEDDYDKNSISGRYLQENLDDSLNERLQSAFTTLYDRENERLEKLKEYGSDQLNPTSDQKRQSLVDTENFIDEKDNPDGYKYHDIEINLGESIREKLENKTFSEYRSLLQEEYNGSADDLIMGSDISDLPATGSIGEEYGTQQFMAIEDIRTDKVIYLRPTFENISEDIQINNGDFFYIGRTEPFPNYENTTRAITLSFKMYAHTPNEYLLMWKKMDFLNSLAYPIATQADDFKSVQNPLLKFTVGNLFNRIGGYLNTLNYTYSNQDITWETAKGKVAPKIIDVSMSFTILHDEMPFVHKNNEFNFDKSEGSNQFNFYDVDYSDLNDEG